MTCKFPNLLGWLLSCLAILPAVAPAQETADDSDGKWRGKLYCLARWADRANPEEPKTIEEAFLDTTELRPRVLPGLGKATLPVDSTVEGTQQWFDQGLACLHLLWDKEAERAFREVVTADPNCALGYWGLAMVNFDRPGRGAFFSRTAAYTLKRDAPAMPRALVDATARLFKDPATPLERRLLAFARELESLAMAEPGTPELKALLFRQLVLNDFRAGIAVRSPWAVDRLAAEVIAENPDHPCRHTRLFLWMKNRPSQLVPAGLIGLEALDTPAPAWRYLAEGQQALGQWDDAARSLVRAFRAELDGRQNWFEHPVEGPAFIDDGVALIDLLSRMGRTGEAFRVAEALMADPLPGAVATDDTEAAFLASGLGRGALAYARVCHEHRLLDRLPGLSTTVAALVNDLPAADAIKVKLTKWTAVGSPAVDEGLSVESMAHHHLVEENFTKAIEILAGLTDTQRSAFLPRALWIAAHAGAGNEKEALYGFDKAFRQQAGAADSPLRNLAVLRQTAAVRRLPSVWQLPATPIAIKLGTDLRKTLATSAAAIPQAPAFVLPDGHDAAIALQSFRGKPVVVIFFLGAGCFQCVEQLHAFLPEAESYKQAGIPIVCVSSDPISVLQYSVTEKARGGQPIPFTILSDDRLKVFRQYLVYNDFEKRPLHGTFLLDADGKVRWKHVGNRPFMNPKWLLKEAARVLGE